MSSSPTHSSHSLIGCGITLIICGVVVVLIAVSLPVTTWNSPAGRLFSQFLDRIGLEQVIHRRSVPTPDVQNRTRMLNVKTALICYLNDLGKLPFTGTTVSSTALDLANTHCLGTTHAKNVLVNDTVGKPFENLGIPLHLYRRQWKGPYMDSVPGDFMNDFWGRKMLYTLATQTVYLHSAGPDGKHDRLESGLTPGYTGDDVIVSVCKIRFPSSSPAEVTPTTAECASTTTSRHQTD